MSLREQYRDKGLIAVVALTSEELREKRREELEALIARRADEARKTALAQLHEALAG